MMNYEYKERGRRIHVTIQLDCDKSNIFFDADKMEQFILATFNLGSELIYCCWAVELTPTTNRAHIHVYLEFANAHHCTAIKKVFSNAHVVVHDGVLSPVELRNYVSKNTYSNPKTFYEIGDFNNLKGKSTKKKKKSVEEELHSLVDKYNTYEECVQEQPVLATKYREAVQVLLESKKQKEKQLQSISIIADNGDEIFVAQRQIYFLKYPKLFDVTQYIYMKYGKDVSIVRDVNPKKCQYDDYHSTKVIVIDMKNNVMPIGELERFLGTDNGKLPCRYNNKVNLSQVVIVASQLEFKKAFSVNVPKYCINAGIWTLVNQDGNLYIYPEYCKKDTDPPVSLQNIKRIEVVKNEDGVEGQMSIYDIEWY